MPKNMMAKMTLARINKNPEIKKHVHNSPCSASTPVKYGETDLAICLAMLTVPRTFGRSFDSISDVRIICRGTTSNAVVVWLRRYKMVAIDSFVPKIGMAIKNKPHGICVRMVDLSGPHILDIHADGMAERETTKSVLPNIRPRTAAVGAYLMLK